MRRFVMNFTAAALCVLPVAFVGAVGVAAMVLPPRGPERLEWVRLIEVESLPEDGSPERVPVIVPHYEGWIRHPDRQVDWAFVRRVRGGTVQVLNPRHHLGAMVEYDASKRRFRSCCFGVEFDLDGKRVPGTSSNFSDLQKLESRVSAGSVYIRSDQACNRLH